MHNDTFTKWPTQTDDDTCSCNDTHNHYTQKKSHKEMLRESEKTNSIVTVLIVLSIEIME